jgi:hypothetical protein
MFKALLEKKRLLQSHSGPFICNMTGATSGA